MTDSSGSKPESAEVSHSPKELYSPIKIGKPLGEFLQKVAAHLVVAILVGATTYAWTILHEKRRIEEAPTVYVQEIDKLINTAAEEGEDNAITNAKAIVAARNSLAGSLSAIGSQLDSQIDVLATQIGLSALVVVTPRSRQADTKIVPDKHEVYMQISVLKKIWPAKRRQIEVELRKLFAELGLYGGSQERPSTK